MRGDFDIIFDDFSRASQPHIIQHTPCAVLYVVPMLIGCWLVFLIRCCDQFGTSGISRRHERALHAVCVVSGIAALLGFFLRCRDLNLEYVSLRGQLTDTSRYVTAAPGTASDSASDSASQHDRLDAVSQETDGLPGLLWGWALVPAVLAVLVWIQQRLRYHQLLRDWSSAAAASHDGYDFSFFSFLFFPELRHQF